MVGLTQVPGVRVVVDAEELIVADDRPDASAQARHYRAQKLRLLGDLAAAGPAGPEDRSIVLRFDTPPVRITESDGALAVDIDDHGTPSTLTCGLVPAAIGLHGSAVPGLPFDESAGIIPNTDGRVLGDDGAPLPGVYVAGWIKRGPTGVIGTNKQCARGTVDALIEDFTPAMR